MLFDVYEVMAGTAGFSAYISGLADGYGLMPYQGAKWRDRKALKNLVKDRGNFEPEDMDAAHLNDLGPWGPTWKTLLNGELRAGVVEVLQESLKDDPKETYARLHGARVPTNDVLYAAQFLWLQRLSFGNKAVGVKEGRWASPGLNESSAYGKEATERFGKINPMIPSLLDRLKGYKWERAEKWTATQLDAPSVVIPKTTKRKLVLIDPPYENKTGYPLEVETTRLDVAALGAQIERRIFSGMIVITEAEPVEELVEAGWETEKIAESRHHDGSAMKGKHEEWATYVVI